MAKDETIKTRLAECLSEDCVKKYVQDFYKSEDKDYYPSMAMARWRKGTHYPPVAILVGMAKVLNTNVAYILGLTDVSCPLEIDEPAVDRTLGDLLDAAEMSERELVKNLNNNYKKLLLYRERIPYERIRSLIKLSEALNLSIDYILGYTNFTNWDVCAKMNRPFSNIEAGAGAYVIADKSIRALSDVEDAISRGDGSYCLLTIDGKYVLFPNGNKVSIDDPLFNGIYVAKVVPEVK